MNYVLMEDFCSYVLKINELQVYIMIFPGAAAAKNG